MSTPRPTNDGNVTANDFYQQHYFEFPLCFEQQPEVFKFAQAFADSRIEDAARIVDIAKGVPKRWQICSKIRALRGTK